MPATLQRLRDQLTRYAELIEENEKLSLELRQLPVGIQTTRMLEANEQSIAALKRSRDLLRERIRALEVDALRASG
jgi:hypothetical protein